MNGKTKLELTWIGKEERPRLEPRILIERPEHSVPTSDGTPDNILIHGDNLLALKALESRFAGEVKCVFIDPPYNTGSAYEHYDDGVEHSLWLSLMRDRLEVLRSLLREDGSIWITLDDNEAFHFRLLLDEIFGRKNFVQCIIWQKRTSPANDALHFSRDHDYIFVYAKNIDLWRPIRIPMNESQEANYRNPDNDSRGPWNSAAYTCAKTAEERPNLYYPIINPFTNEEIWPRRTRVWAYERETHLRHVSERRIYWGQDGTSSSPRIKKFLTESKPVVPRSIWLNTDVGHNQEARMESLALFGSNAFTAPKPERLMHRIIQIATKPGDLVLDSFAGSGTTGAVAHKMGRRWLMIELRDHAISHVVPRMQRVVGGSDEGGISALVGWQGGGGFRFYRLAPSMLERDRWGNWVVSKDYNPAMLAEAMCRHMGFTYAPSQDPKEYWKHGYSTERDFIYVTTQAVTHTMLAALSNEVGNDRRLLVCCKAFSGKADAFDNLTIRKIPNAVLANCEWGRDDYSLKIAPSQEAPVSEPVGEEPEPEGRARRTTRRARAKDEPGLFDATSHATEG